MPLSIIDARCSGYRTGGSGDLVEVLIQLEEATVGEVSLAASLTTIIWQRSVLLLRRETGGELSHLALLSPFSTLQATGSGICAKNWWSAGRQTTGPQRP